MEIFTAKLRVRTYECDSYGHVNNAVYLHYLEYARMEALYQKGYTLGIMKEKGFLVVVRRIEIDYKHPLFMNDEVVIQTNVSDARQSSGSFTQKVIRQSNERIAALAKVTWVFTDLTGKPIPIPDEIRTAFGMHLTEQPE